MIPYEPARLAAGLAALLLLTHPAPSSAAPTTIATTAETRLDHISVVEMGKGSPVVLIPGLSSPRGVWDEVAARLAATHRVVLVQVNGFGGDAPGANLQDHVLDGVVADLDRYLTTHRAAGAAVVGHSMGGLLALKLAAAHPADVGRLMIVDALPFYGRLFGPGSTPAMLEPRAAAMRDAMKARYGKPADPAATDALVAQMALKPGSRARLLAWGPAVDQRVAAQAMYEDLTTDVTADLPRLAAPVTLVVPYNDHLPQPMVDQLYRGAYAGTPRLTVVEVPDAAHFVMLDQPAAFAKALDAFLAG